MSAWMDMPDELREALRHLVTDGLFVAAFSGDGASASYARRRIIEVLERRAEDRAKVEDRVKNASCLLQYLQNAARNMPPSPPRQLEVYGRGVIPEEKAAYAEEPRCELCVHFLRHEYEKAVFISFLTRTPLTVKSGTSFGVCRRYPPGTQYSASAARGVLEEIIHKANSVSSFPNTTSSECCGEFKRKP